MQKRFVKKAVLGDPSSDKQSFIDLKLKLLCCRYWSLELWDCYDMAFPFWRIYWNKNKGGEIRHLDELYLMHPKYIYIITPFTSFSTSFANRHVYTDGIHVSGRHITQNFNESASDHNTLIHFFTHFNLGVPFDNVLPGIFKVELSISLLEKLAYLTHRLKIKNKDFKVVFNLKLQAFVKDVLSEIGTQLWEAINIDQRILMVLRYIEANVNRKLSNSELASFVNMAPNSFARLFKEEMNFTLYKFIQKRKIARACDLFEHSDKSIEEVAFNLGFANRYHFSRVFKTITSITPAVYRSGKYKRLTII